MAIRVADLFGPYCVTTQDGERLYQLIAKELAAGRSVELDFTGVRDVISAFLNPAIGSLYGDFPKDVVESCLRITGLDESDEAVVRIVRDRAIDFFNASPTIRNSLREASSNPVEA